MKAKEVAYFWLQVEPLYEFVHDVFDDVAAADAYEAVYF